MCCPAPLLQAADALLLCSDEAQAGQYIYLLRHMCQIAGTIPTGSIPAGEQSWGWACYSCGSWGVANDAERGCYNCRGTELLRMPCSIKLETGKSPFWQGVEAELPALGFLSQYPWAMVRDTFSILVSWVTYLMKHLRRWNAWSLPSVPLLAGDHILCVWRMGGQGPRQFMWRRLPSPAVI